ncbi:hypothetical protein DFH11DRAFT_1590880 [Phellopilus nigrolimitatus]|nr:hypothetical protein DFH11DRAFT_1590880 [Phellopilus nigrolimitatus]
MANEHTSNAPSDEATEANSTLLETCQRAENTAKYRAICRENGLPDGAQELRRLQHFVSQAVIQLLTKHNITQKDGRPYVASSPKGFLQGPNVWLMDKGYYISGWPRGLPSGSISIWPAHYTFALAAMFIKKTISLVPLNLAPGQQMKQASASTVVSTKKAKPKQDNKQDSVNQSLNVPPSAVVTKVPYMAATESEESDLRTESCSGSDSDEDAEGSSESDSVSGSSTKSARKKPDSVARVSASGSSTAKRPLSSVAPNSTSSLATAPRSKGKSSGQMRPQSSSAMRPKRASSGAGPAGASTLFPLPADINVDLADARAFEALASANGFPLSQIPGSGSKRKAPAAPEVIYPGVPAGATVNWMPPTSAARESKKVRRT